jgi:glutamyl-tRNA synthetase
MATTVRVRYAPSPTGMQHIGGVRTALFNYFFARSQGGRFVLRIEDTDQTRFDPRALEDIYATFEWLGISADEIPADGGAFGPYVQSERLDLYRTHADGLVKAGRAYWDYTSARKPAAAEGADGDAPAGYNYEGRDLSPEKVAEYQAAGVQPVLRLLVPADGATEFDDLVLGRIKRKNKDLPPDPILLKSDGYPTYHLANVIDDHLMEITHVLRAQEWVPSTPLHLLIYEAFGWEPPRFAHLPMVMGKDGSKLSKRHGSTSVVEFRRQGYLPEAITNYISMLGWSYDDSREFFTREELEELFSIERINKAPAVFDYKKLDWYNGQYLRRAGDERLVALLTPYLEEAGWIGDGSVSDAGPTEADRRRLTGLLPLIKERLKVLGDVTDLLRFVYEPVTTWPLEDLTPKKASPAEALRWLDAATTVLTGHGLPAPGDDAGEEALNEAFRVAAEAEGTKLGNLMMPLRVAITGSRVSPPLVGSIRELGMDKALERIAGARSALEHAAE